MCGFIGFTGQIENREQVLRKMADRIAHRGPDMEGFHVAGDGQADSIALGFRRLSIIDLADGAQPMYNEDGTVVVVYNGEVYNFMDLRQELIARGHVFKTRCDTEVILHGYEEYGEGLAARLRGMFAYGIKKQIPCMGQGTLSVSNPIIILFCRGAHFCLDQRSKAFWNIPFFAERSIQTLCARILRSSTALWKKPFSKGHISCRLPTGSFSKTARCV